MTLVVPVRRQVEQPRAPVLPVGGDFPLEEKSWEFKLAAKHTTLYPLIRTAADIVPFASKLFPSGWKEFQRMTTGQKALDIGLDVAIFVPAGWIGKGFKAASKPLLIPVRAGAKRLPFRVREIGEFSKPYLDTLAKQVDNFVPRDENWFLRKYQLDDLEKYIYLQREGTSAQGFLRYGRGGGMVRVGRKELFTPEEIKRLYTKEGKLRTKVQRDLIETLRPLRAQRLEHHVREYERLLSGILPKEGKTIEQVFNRQVERLFGKDKIGRLTLKNIGEEDLKTVLMDLLINRGRVLRGLDLSSYHWVAPVRKVLGKFDARFGTLRIYKTINNATGNANKASMLYADQFTQILKQKGLVEEGKFGLKRFFSRTDADEAANLLRKVDVAQAQKVPQETMQSWIDSLASRRPAAAQLFHAYHQWTDFMYGEFMKEHIPALFRRAGLTERGKLFLKREFERGFHRSITAYMSGAANLSQAVKAEFVEGTLSSLRKLVQKNPVWFKSPGGKRVQRLLEELTPRAKGADVGFPNYLENYMARLFEIGKPKAPVKPGMTPTQLEAGFLKTRVLEEVGEDIVNDIFKLVEVRARQQGKQLYLYPELNKLTGLIKGLPPGLQKYIDHYLRRLLGMPSPIDTKVAQLLTRTLGGSWDERRVMQLAWTINDLVMMGGLGFKPFSALRNLFQTPLLVPTDMGGIKDIYWLARGLPRAMRPDTFRYLKEIGAITEFSPDILFKPKLPRPGRKLLGIGARELEFPTMQKTRDVAMWMFKKSDEWNRTWTGSAALEKWDHFFRKIQPKDQASLKLFKRKINLKGREDWVQADIERALDAGSFEEARRIWVKDVVADTQFLYGAADSPLLGQRGGSIGKTAVIFQSWWMNYSSLLGKWITRSGSIDAAAERMFSWMFTGAILGTAMTQIWGKGRGTRAALLGPLPSQLDVPAPWRPLVEALDTIRVLAEQPITRDPEKLKRQVKTALKSTTIYAPGGLWATQLIKGASREGWSGFKRAIIGYNPPED